MLAKKNEYIKEAVDEVEIINRDKALREEYLKRMMAVMDEESQKESYFEEGLKDGLKQGKLEVAINAIKLGLTNEQIYAITGISEEELEEIKQKL